MKKIKLKWKVQPAPTGLYRTFSNRPWPWAYFDKENDFVAARIDHVDREDYSAYRAKSDSQRLIVTAAVYVDGNWRWQRIKKVAKSYAEAKEIANEFFSQNRDLMPEEFR